MSNQSLHSKTIRPGSLNGYSYYYSNRQPVARQAAAKPKRDFSFPVKGKGLLVIGVLLALVFLPILKGGPAPAKKATSGILPTAPSASTALAEQGQNHCAGNSLDKLIKVSISQRHLWACEGGYAVRDSAVITGLVGHAETETPTGTYHIYAKQKDTTLTGSDSRGSWRDPVYYWMPFLDNQYGTYGFHDATWRPADAFGNVSPNSKNASHGCVELPLAASKWLYYWATTGTTVKIES
jgi:lipoprotein-anchoring transpeptidase ErfK/SrfK